MRKLYCKTCFDRNPHKEGTHFTEYTLENGQTVHECTECGLTFDVSRREKGVRPV